ncbi:class I SAM-dependent methyltransferase [Abyssisolibacter fermentans]|uniref:class I SAM-dependent methyltransferase n=1 Tax=Abyssisolibacter fermentans TaxID=1766203 RepID=UPI00082CC12D|nr:class I SAM-dependent methyltransferase [Abyssisolibacter fermentans]
MKITNWSERVQSIKTLDSSRELRFTGKNINEIVECIHLNDGMNVLEVGCGAGTLTRKLSKKFKNAIITGLDMDRNFVNYCIEQAKLTNLSNVKYDICDALSLPYADNSFDICTSHTVIEHVNNREFLQEQFRVCKPNGYVSIMNVRPELSLENKSNDQSHREIDLLTKINNITEKYNEEMNVGFYFDNPQNIMRTFEEIGFREIQIDVISYVTCVDDYRNSNKLKKQIIESERYSIIEYINRCFNIKPDVLAYDEKVELLDLVNSRFENRLCMVDNGKYKWDFKISPMIIITGRKPAHK